MADSNGNNFYIGENLAQTKIKFKLLKICRGARGYPSFHLQINEKVYFYGFRGIRKDDRIILVCSKTYENGELTCSQCCCTSYILPSEGLKEIIQKSENIQNYIKARMGRKRMVSKTMDTSDPRVYDIENYNINSFEIGKGHKCSGTELAEYIKKN